MKSKLLLLTSTVVALFSGLSSAQDSAPGTAPTKATFLITGLHCPPCTGTVQSSLSRVKGIKSVAVDWNKKNAKIEFDERLLPAQSLASAIASTPHMMGAGMKYDGWLVLSVPSIADEPSGQKVKTVLSKMDGVKTVAVYPAQHSAAVLFVGKGTMSSRQMIDALAKEGIEATNF
jgi:copper chaperone CopZ